MPRFSLRCPDCLVVGFADATESREVAGWKCDCGSFVEIMGRVRGLDNVQARSECPCNGVCTNAKGPNCDCRCGGVNHGSQRIITTWNRTGAAPVIKWGDKLRTKRQEQQAEEWRERRDKVIFGIGLQRAAKRNTYNSEYWLDQARESRTHLARMRKVQKAEQLLGMLEAVE